MSAFNQKDYYIDIDRLLSICQTNYQPQTTDFKNAIKEIETEAISEEEIADAEEIVEADGYEEGGAIEINIFKYEMYKMCIDRVMYDNEGGQEDADVFGNPKTPASYSLAFNTLLKYEIIKEDE